MRGVAALLSALALASCGAWAATPFAAAATVTDGRCSTDTGVTLVVDHQELGGGVVVKCVEDVPVGTSGLGLLRLAGFTSEGTVHDGSSFVCRVGGRPGPNETIPLSSDPGYREQCINTPPDDAFWGYWHATNGGSWTFSSYGAGSREVVPGGYEGLSFSLNNSSRSNPPPGLTPSHTVVTPVPAPTPTPAPAPTIAKPVPAATPKATPTVEPLPQVEKPSLPRRTERPTRPAHPDPSPSPTHSPEATPTPTAALPSPTPEPGAVEPSASPSGSVTDLPSVDPTPPVASPPITAAPPVEAVVEDNEPPVGTLIGAGAVAALALGGGVVWWRRRGL